MSALYYDGQIRRFLLQFARMFSNFEVESGLDANNLPVTIRVPVRYGDVSRQAQTILQDNSRNNMPSAPQMSFYITDLKYRRTDVQAPAFVDNKIIQQRAWDTTTQTFEHVQGNAFNVKRLMPVPYELSLSLDIWTTNTNMKLQIMEQILTLFNPSLEIQSTDNYLDWTSLSAVEIKDTIWSSRSVPNNDDSIDIATLKFSLPIWISPPASVTKGGVIHKVIASMYDETGNLVDAIDSDDLLLGTRVKITPHGYQVYLLGNELRILPMSQPGDNMSITSYPAIVDTSLSWRGIIDEFGALNNGISQVRLMYDTINELEVIGTVSYSPTDDNILLFTVDTDTIPVNTLSAINAVIDPLKDGPGYGLASAAIGQRYLILEDIGSTTNISGVLAWGNLIAKKNDIIEFNGTNWYVSFDANNYTGTTPEYLTNITTGVQYKFLNNTWQRSYEGLYGNGNWSIVI